MFFQSSLSDFDSFPTNCTNVTSYDLHGKLNTQKLHPAISLFFSRNYGQLLHNDREFGIKSTWATEPRHCVIYCSETTIHRFRCWMIHLGGQNFRPGNRRNRRKLCSLSCPLFEKIGQFSEFFRPLIYSITFTMRLI